MHRIQRAAHTPSTRRQRLGYGALIGTLILLLVATPLIAAGLVTAQASREQTLNADNVWLLDKVYIDGELQDTLAIDFVSTGGRFKLVTDGTTDAIGDMSGFMEVTYPEQIVSSEPAIFAIENAIGMFNWVFGPKYKSSSVGVKAEFYDFHRYIGHDCEIDEEKWIGGGGQGSANFGLPLAPFECIYEPPDDYFSAYETLKFVFRLVVSIDYCDNWGCKGLGFKIVPIQLNYELQTEPTATIVGKAYVPNPTQPLIGVPVAVVREGEVLRRTISQPPDGHYKLQGVPITDNLAISVTLEHAATHPSTFRIDYGNDATPAYATHGPFATTETENPMTRDFPFVKRPNIVTDPGINLDHLDDLGTIYYHTHQAWQLTDQLKQPLDFKLPLDIIAFSARPETYWQGPMTNGLSAGADPFINIEAGISPRTYKHRPDNREWHEFGHHVMADVDNNLQPADAPGCPNPEAPGHNCNHYGYGNTATTDSWVEGFAEFYSMMVAREIDNDPRPELYSVVNMENQNNAEGNFLAWTDEEFAVAGLLLDLVDPVDEGDLSPSLGDDGFADCVQIDFETELWPIITKNWNSVVAGSPVSPTFGFIMDVKQLYDALKHEGVGAAKSRGRASIDDLDELFIAHGFFADMANLDKYDAGEEVGRAAYPAAPNRRAHPAEPGSYIAYRAVDQATGSPLDIQDFTVDIRFDPPFDLYNYQYQAVPTNAGRLYYFGPDPQYAATTSIIARSVSHVSTTPFEFDNATYWQRMGAEPDDYFIETTIEMARMPAVFLPLVFGDDTVTNARSSPATVATPTRTPIPCSPINGNPPTPTPTGSPTVTPPPPTATPASTPTPTPPGGESEGVYGQVTVGGAPTANLGLSLEFFDGADWSVLDAGWTNEDGEYHFAQLPTLGGNEAYLVSYDNVEKSPDRLSFWFGNLIEEYRAGDLVAGGDFDLTNITLTSPDNGTGVNLPAQFCWEPRGIATDNYVWMLYYPDIDQFASTEYLGNVSCVNITGIPPEWPAGVEYRWWVRAYQGQDPDATPWNYGGSYWARAVTVNSTTITDKSAGEQLRLEDGSNVKQVRTEQPQMNANGR